MLWLKTTKIPAKLSSNGIQINPITNARVDKWEMSVRKFAHYVLFAIGGLIIYVMLHQFQVKHKILIAIFFGMLLACMDEMHQFFSANRGPRLFDVGLDSLGVVSGVLLGHFCTKIMNQFKKGKKFYDKLQKNHCGEDCKSG